MAAQKNFYTSYVGSKPEVLKDYRKGLSEQLRGVYTRTNPFDYAQGSPECIEGQT